MMRLLIVSLVAFGLVVGSSSHALADRSPNGPGQPGAPNTTCSTFTKTPGASANAGGSPFIAADRALSILIDGESNNFTVRVGIGKWLEHLGVTAVEALLISEIFLLVDIPEMLWNVHVENKLVKEIDSIVG